MRNKYLWLLGYILLLLGGKAVAQDPYYRQITTDDGLPSMEVYDIFQDSRDFIWIGTDKGLCRYDGQKFKYFSNKGQKGTSVDVLREDSKGKIWCKNFSNQIFYIEEDSMYLFDRMNELLSETQITAYDLDINDRIWIYNNQQIWVYAQEGDSLIEIPLGTKETYFQHPHCGGTLSIHKLVTIDTFAIVFIGSVLQKISIHSTTPMSIQFFQSRVD